VYNVQRRRGRRSSDRLVAARRPRCRGATDNDDAGRKYASAVIAELVRLRPLPNIRKLHLPDLAAGGDLDDYVTAHANESPDEIVAALADQLAPVTPAQLDKEPTKMPANPAAAGGSESIAPQAVFTRLAECTPTCVTWLWPGRVPLGKLTLLIGDPGLGKSFVTLDVAARVSRGLSMPALDGEAPLAATAPGSVLLLSAEDDALDTIYPRLAAAGADLTRIDVLKAIRVQRAGDGGQFDAMFSLQSDLAVLEEAIAERDNCRLVVIDPITAYLGRSDSHRNSEMRALLAPLSELAARTGVAVLAVNHLNKMGQGPAIYRSMGSLAFAATARSVLAVMCDPNDAASRVLVSLKSNVSAEVQGMRFQMMTDAESTAGIEPGGERPMPTIRWSDTPLAMTAEEIISAAAQSAECGPALDEACEWLRSVLTTGPQAAVELKRIAKEDGIRERTLVRAKQRLGVLAARTGFGLHGLWEWRLPESKSGDGKQSDGQLPDA
jgi:putative DNA primase/helicase